MSNKQGVKRPKGQSHPQNFTKRIYAARDESSQVGRFIATVHTENEFIIALGRMKRRKMIQGFKFDELNKVLSEVRHDYEDINIEDHESGMYLRDAESYFDNELHDFLGEGNYVDRDTYFDIKKKTYGLRLMELAHQKEEKHDEE